jgi:hypothetical protein
MVFLAAPEGRIVPGGTIGPVQFLKGQAEFGMRRGPAVLPAIEPAVGVDGKLIDPVPEPSPEPIGP